LTHGGEIGRTAPGKLPKVVYVRAKKVIEKFVGAARSAGVNAWRADEEKKSGPKKAARKDQQCVKESTA